MRLTKRFTLFAAAAAFTASTAAIAAPTFINVLTGGTSGVYYPIGVALSQIYGTSIERLYAEPRLDTLLQSGDQVIVKEDDRYFLSVGAAGQEALHPFTKDVFSAMDAVSVVGGVDDRRADPRGILILREYPVSALAAGVRGPRKQRVVFSIDLTSADGLFSARNFQVMPKDLIYVTESPVTAAGTVFGLVGSVFGLVRRSGL